MITFNGVFLGIHMEDIQFSRKISEEVMNLDDAILGVSVIGDTGKVLIIIFKRVWVTGLNLTGTNIMQTIGLGPKSF